MCSVYSIQSEFIIIFFFRDQATLRQTENR